jgi:hypothetical protein
LGLQNQPYLQASAWQAQVSYQYADTNDFFVGDQRNDAAGPDGKAPRRKVNIWALDIVHAFSNRFSLDLTLPFLSGSGGFQFEGVVYDYHAGGLGDLALSGEYWLNDPTRPSRFNGSVSVGLKAPTGSDTVQGVGPSGQAPIDEAFQLGNGGWEMLLRIQGYAPIGGPFAVYGSGYYGLSLTGHTNVNQGGALRGVPDTYSARLGAGYLLPFLEGLVFTAGGRINGVTVKDLIGGGDLYWRRPGYEVYFEPGLSLTLGRNTASVSIPIRIYQNKLNSVYDNSIGAVRGSDFAPFLVVASYGRRF